MCIVICSAIDRSTWTCGAGCSIDYCDGGTSDEAEKKDEIPEASNPSGGSGIVSGVDCNVRDRNVNTSAAWNVHSEAVA